CQTKTTSISSPDNKCCEFTEIYESVPACKDEKCSKEGFTTYTYTVDFGGFKYHRNMCAKLLSDYYYNWSDANAQCSDLGAFLPDSGQLIFMKDVIPSHLYFTKDLIECSYGGSCHGTYCVLAFSTTGARLCMDKYPTSPTLPSVISSARVLCISNIW
ncbi:hypothetical protein IJ541_11610, partial [bacterium]|nr:hypothetical protein [bacterium]